MGCTLSVARSDGDGEDWPFAYVCNAKKMTFQTIHTSGSLLGLA